MSRLHVYAVFDEQTGTLVAIAASVLGAGAAAIAHAGSVLAAEGTAASAHHLASLLAEKPSVVLHDAASAEPLIRIERHFLAP